MKVMFICTGNICRSAMAEAFMKKVAKERSLDIEVCSSGTFAENGAFASYNAIEAMKIYDIDLRSHRSTNIADSDILNMDLILCATLSHKISVMHMYPEIKEKVYTMKEYAEILGKDRDYDIKDPWGYNLDTFLSCASEVEGCVEKIIDKIQKNNKEY